MIQEYQKKSDECPYLILEQFAPPAEELYHFHTQTDTPVIGVSDDMANDVVPA